MTTFSSLRASTLELHVRNLLGDNVNYTTSDPYEVSSLTWSTSVVMDALNFAIREVCKRTGATRAIRSVNLVTSTTPPNPIVSPHRFILPSDYLALIRVISPDGRGVLVKTNREDEIAENPFFDLQTATNATRWYQMDGRTVHVWGEITDPTQAFTLEYLQSPWPLAANDAIAATAIHGAATDGQWYEIASVGTTNFTAIGASASAVGVQFQATAAGTGTGAVYEIADPRITPIIQEHLKYSAAAFLLNMQGDQQSLALADKYMQMFNALIGA